MRLVDCVVRLGGKMDMQIPKASISVAEVAVLRMIHGHDAVVSIFPRSNDRRSHRDEKDRLRHEYRTVRVGDNGPNIVDHMWPGHDPKLPVDLSDLGIGEDSPTLEVNAEKPVAEPPPAEPEPARRGPGRPPNAVRAAQAAA